MCILYDAVETSDHLLLHCSVARAVLFGSNMGLRVNENDSVKQTVARRLHEKGDFSVFILGSCAMWAIWKARNGKIFDKNNPSIQRIILETHFWYNYNLPNSEDASITPNSTTATPRSRSINLERWVPPATNWI